MLTVSAMWDMKTKFQAFQISTLEESEQDSFKLKPLYTRGENPCPNKAGKIGHASIIWN
jgi:hypothetical protein